MMARQGKILVVVALATTTGLHWAALQLIAWATMLAANLSCQSLPGAVAETFDGKHPCPLCKAIAAAKKSEKKSEFAPQKQKFEFPPTRQNVVLLASIAAKQFSPIAFYAPSRPYKPPTPPPRAA